MHLTPRRWRFGATAGLAVSVSLLLQLGVSSPSFAEQVPVPSSSATPVSTPGPIEPTPASALPTPVDSATPGPTTTPTVAPTASRLASPQLVRPMAGELTTNDVNAPVITVPTTNGANIGGVYAPRVNAPATTISVSNGTWSPSGTYTYKYSWYLCSSASNSPTDTLPAGCTQTGVTGTTNTLSITTSMSGLYVVAGVTATRATPVGSGVKYTKSTLAVREKPINTVNPSISSANLSTASTFTANNGTWTGFGNVSFTYAWYTCTAATTAVVTKPAACTVITPAVTTATYTPSSATAGKRLVVEVKGTNDAQATAVSKFSASTGVLATPVANTAVPTLTMVNSASTPVNSKPTVGNTITTTSGTWTGTATITYAYQWYRCDSEQLTAPASLPGDCVATSGTGATATTYTVQAADAGKYLLASVRADNGASSPKTVFSKSAGTVTKSATIVAGSEPAVSGDSKVGSTHTATSGTWTGGVPVPTFTYEWFTCAAKVANPISTIPVGNACSSVQATTVVSPTQYVAKSADIGRFLTVKVTPVNGAPNTAMYSASTPIAVGTAPVNSVAPKFTTTSGVSPTIPSSSGTVTAVAGTWTGTPTPTLSILWYICTSATNVSSTLPDSCRALTTDDTSNPSARTLAVSNQWAGKFLVVAETATNSFGTPTVWAASTGAVNVPAALTQDPILTGNAVDGNVLGVTNVSKSGFDDPTVTYQWFRCTSPLVAAVKTTSATAAPTGCSAITGAGASSETYTLVYADASKYMSVRVGVTNPANAAGEYRWTATSAQVTSPAKNTVVPAVTIGSPSTTGKPRVGGTVSTTGGTWTGFPAVSLGYRWYLCDTAYPTVPTDLPQDCVALSVAGATTSSLSVTDAMVTKFLLVEVTGTSGGVPSAPSYSASTATVTQPPAVITPPSFAPNVVSDGDRRFVDQRLDGSIGSFTDGTPAATIDQISYNWLSCVSPIVAPTNVRPANCTVVAALTTSYTALATDAGKFITVEEIHRNEAGVATSIAATGSRAVAQSPTNSVAPTVTGSPWVGKVLTAANGTWAGPPAPTVTREWMTCPTALATAGSAPPADCTTLLDGTGAPITSATYTVAPGDEGEFILAKITASTDRETVVRYTASTTVIKVKPTVVTYPLIADLDQPGGDSSTNSGIVGYPHSATGGTWSGSSPLANPAAYQWYLCTNAVSTATTTAPTSSGCTAIASATTKSYTPVAANAGKYLTFTETQTNGTEPVTAWAASTPGPIVTFISAPSPAPVVSVVQTPASTTPKLGPGTSVTTTNGVWAATPAVSFRYQWYSCATVQSATPSAVPGGCDPVSGATSQSLPLGLDRTDLIGKFLLVKVTAFHPLTPKNIRSIYSASTLFGVQSKPQVKTASSITGVPYVAATLTANPGDAFALPAATPKYQWLTCTSAVDAPVAGLASARPSACLPITGAIAQTYAVAEADFGKFITVQVTWTNTLDTVGTVSFAKSTSVIVRGPVNRVVPVIQARAAGPVVGEDIRVQSIPADWTGSPTLSYQWYSCSASVSSATDALPGVCSIIQDAQSDTFRVRSTDERLYFIAGVTATNGEGQSTKFTATSAQTLSIPASTVDPELTGKSFVGTKITASTGTWTGFPTPTYSYAWFVCSTATTSHLPGDATCSSTAVATTATYTPVASQVGSSLRVRVTATNAAGATEDWTATTDLITEGPFIITPATIRGTADVGSTTPLTVTPGSWGGNPYPVISGQWMRCQTNQPTAVAGAVPSGCSAIEGQTDLNYSLRAEDAGKFITYVETAHNDYGDDYETSVSTAQVTMAPTVTVEPGISGAPEVGGTLTRVAGTWIGFPAPENPATGASTWWRCTSAVPNPSSTQPAGCVQIAAATSNTYTVVAADKGFFIVFREQKKNGATGTLTVNRFTSSTQVVTSPPVRATDVVVTSTDRMTGGAQPRVAPVVGKFIGYTAGAWTGTTDITHRWFRCTSDVTIVSDTVPAGCSPSDAADASSPTYLVTAADLDYFLVNEETAANVAATRTRYSKSTLVVQQLPTVSVAPTVTGSRAIGQVLTVNRGEWAGTADITTAVEWYRCTSTFTDSSTLPAGCSSIGGQTADTYTIANADANAYVTARIVARNPATALAAPATVTFTAPVTEAERTAKAPDHTAVGFVAPAVSLVETANIGLANIGESFLISTSSTPPATGTWPGASPAPTFTYSWYECSTFHGSADTTVGSDCTLISGETRNELIIGEERTVGSYVRALVTATNTAGSDFVYTSTPSAQIAPAGLHFTTEPTVSPRSSLVYAPGTTVTITADPGVWEPAGATQTYQWVRCRVQISSVLYDNAGYGCLTITGATTLSYTVQALDAGKYLSIIVRQANGTEIRKAISASTDMILEAPSLTATQVVTGTNTVGETLTTTIATWRGAEIPSKTISWYRCDVAIPLNLESVPPVCSLIPNQSASSYVLTNADREKYIASFITTTNATGTATNLSASTAQVRVKPVNLTAPSSTDRPYVGQSFTASLGTWDGFPAATYQVTWYTCSAVVATPATTVQSGVCLQTGSPVNEPAGATTTTITVPSSAQNYLMLKVVASNAAGTATRTSATSQQIWEVPAISTATGATKPATTGTANVGQRINLNNGTWVGFPNPTPSYVWYVCDSAVPTAASTLSSGAGCVATATTTAYYDITITEGGKFLVAGVTQTSASGTGTYYSASTVQIGFEPRATVSPTATLSGGPDTNVVGSVLTATLGTWAGFTTPAAPTTVGVTTYQWYSCTAAISTPSTSLPSGSICAAIPSATGPSYTMAAAEAGKHVAVFVTQENKINGTGVSNYVAAPAQVVAKGTKLSTSTYVRQAPIRIETALESMTGTANVGGSLTLSASTWKGAPTPTTAQTGYEWYVCPAPTSVLTDCSIISGASTATISVIPAYAGKVLFARAWGENSVSRTFSAGLKSQVVSEAPVVVSAPVLTTPAAPKIGAAISASSGTWRSTAGANAPSLDARTYTYTWYSCPAANSLLSACIVRGTPDGSAASYTPSSTGTAGPSDNGRFITAVVKAKNNVNTSATGTTTTPSAAVASQSNVIGPVNYIPTNAGDVSLGGPSATTAAKVGDTLSITGESWSAEPALSAKTYEWFSCPAAATGTRPTTLPTGCTKINSADQSSYTVTTDVGGRHVLARVTATNDVGSTTKYTLSMGAVTMTPAASDNPVISGTPEIGQTLTVTATATWSGFPAPTLTYRWLACMSEQTNSSTSQLTDCSVIAGQTTKNLVLTSAMGVVGKHIVVEEKATNSTGNAVRFSATKGPVSTPPPVVTP